MDNNYEAVDGTELMGKNLLNMLKFCGVGVRLYPLCKIIHPQNAMLDNYCQLMDFSFVDAGMELKIGKFSTITWHCLIEGGARTIIGDRVFVGPGTKILTSTYKLNGYYSIEHIPEICHETQYGDVIIKDDAYIGANCTIMPGTIIDEGAVVGANSLVKGKLEPWTVYAGVPCREINKREKPNDNKREALSIIDWKNHL